MSPAIVAMMLTSGLIGETPTAKDADGKTVMLLAGVGSITVVIEELGEEAKALGLSEDMLKTDVELRLRSARVPLGSDTRAYLYINVLAVRPRKKGAVPMGITVACVDVSLKQFTLFRCDSRPLYMPIIL